jgi:hypothetical protein
VSVLNILLKSHSEYFPYFVRCVMVNIVEIFFGQLMVNEVLNLSGISRSICR